MSSKTEEQQRAEKEAIVLARGLKNRMMNDRENYHEVSIKFGRQKIIQYLQTESIQFEIVNAEFIDRITFEDGPYQAILRNLVQSKDAPKYFQLRRNDGEVMMSFKPGKVHLHTLRNVVEAMPQDELDSQTRKIKELLHKYNDERFNYLFWISLLDKSGKGPGRLLEEHMSEISGRRYKLEVIDDLDYRWKESPDNILCDEKLFLTISVEPQAFGYLPDANTNLGEGICSRLVLKDNVSFFRDSQPKLEERTCGAHFYLNKGEHLENPVRARDILRKIASYEALEFEFRD